MEKVNWEIMMKNQEEKVRGTFLGGGMEPCEGEEKQKRLSHQSF